MFMNTTLSGQVHYSCSPGNLTWRAEEEHPSRWVDVELLKHLRVQQREDDHFLEGLDVLGQPAHGIKLDVTVQSHRVNVGQTRPNFGSVPGGYKMVSVNNQLKFTKIIL